jgi:Uma2 family endonuclease
VEKVKVSIMRSPIHYLSVAEYLEAEAKSEIRHEYVDGEVFAMAGGSKKHNLIAGNIIALLHAYLRGTDCKVYFSDVKVKLKTANQNKTIFYYPDVVVSCSQMEQDEYYLDYPCLIIEVLSPSTETIDRREKLVNYKTIANLQEYVLISQDQVKIEVYRQDLEGNWTKETLIKGNDLRLNSVDLTVSLADIYEDVF